MVVTLTRQEENISSLSFRLDFDSSNNLIYLGLAKIGSKDSDSAWQIRKFTYDASNNLTNIEWAGEDSLFDKVWDNRTTYNYG